MVRPARSARRASAVVLAPVLLAAACTPAPAPKPPAPVRWSDCSAMLGADDDIVSSFGGHLHARCATVPVPLDYDHPSGRTIGIHVVDLHDDRNTRSTGSVIVNFGGPGVSGVDYLIDYAPQLPTLLRRADFVSFDPRGVGSSAPISCLTDAQTDALAAAEPDLTTPAGARRATALTSDYVRACRRRYGAGLTSYDTVATARDMDRVRAATKDDRWTYLGFSYGTKLGWVYARLFPDRVRAAVLDGAGDPTLTTTTAQVQAQLGGFESAFDDFARYCRTLTPCRALGDTHRRVLRLRTAVAAHPLPAGGSRVLTLGLLDTGVLQGLYFRSGWPALARGIVAAAHGDGAGLLASADAYNGRAADGSYDHILDAYNTITCNDAPPGPTPAQLRGIARRWSVQYPLFGPWNAEQLTFCQQWPAPRTPVPAAGPTSRGSILVIGETHDPATPYSGARHLVAALGHARLLTWTGEGHTSFLQNHACIDAYADRVLLTATLPPAGVVCRA